VVSLSNHINILRLFDKLTAQD